MVNRSFCDGGLDGPDSKKLIKCGSFESAEITTKLCVNKTLFSPYFFHKTTSVATENPKNKPYLPYWQSGK
jgi:hypothetical protein